MAIVGFDTFSEPTGNVALGSHSPEIGAIWSVEVAQFTVLFVPDKVQHNRNVLDRARKGDNIGDDDHDVTATLSVGAAARIAGVCARMSTDGYTNQYEAILQFLSATQQDVKLYKNVVGTRTQIGATVTITLAANVECEFKLEIRAGSQQIYIDNVVVMSRTEPDATLAGRQYAGICMNGNNTGNAAISSFTSESVAVPDLAAFLTGQGDIEAELTTDSPDFSAVSLTGTGDVAAALTTNILLAAALSGTGDLDASLTVGAEVELAATMTGTGDVDAALTTDIRMVAALSGNGDIDAALTTDILLAASPSGTGDVAAALTTNILLAATLSGSGQLEGGVTVPVTLTLSAELRGTGDLLASLSGGHALLRFSTYDIYIGNQLVELGVLDDTSVTVSLTSTYTGSRQFGGVTIRLGLGRGPDVAALFSDMATKGAGLRIYRYDATTTPVDALINGNCEAFTGSLLNAWNVYGAGASTARDTVNVHGGTSSVALTRAGSDCIIAQSLVTATRPLTWWRGRTVTFSGWIRATVAARARLVLTDGITFVAQTPNPLHSGSGLFELFTVKLLIGPTATAVDVSMGVIDGNTTAQFDDLVATYEQESVQELVFDGIINTLELDTTALIVGGIQAPVKVLEMKIPVELVKTPPWPAAVSTGAIGQPVPDIFGNVPRSKCLYINRDRTNNCYDYVICKSRWAVYVPAMYRSVSDSSSGQAQVALITPSEYVVTNWLYPGYITARFTVEQIDFGGGEYTIYADVAVNPDSNISRNPAKILRTYLLEAGQTLVATSWDAAEAEYTRLGYVLDFSLTEQIQLQELATDISMMLDSVLERTSMGWTFTPDIRPTTVDYQFTEGTAELTPTIVDISPVALMPLMDETSKVIVKYLPDMLDPSKYLGSVERTLSTSQHASPLELTFPWIREWVVADRIVDYRTKQIRTRDRSLTITGPRVAALPIRSLVTITSPRRRLTNAIYMVKSLQQSVLGQPQLECVAWAPAPYIYEAGPVPTDLILGTFQDFSRIPPPIITDITFPAGAPYAGVETGPAGAMEAFVTMRFTTPTTGNYAYAVVRYRVTTSTLWIPQGGPITQLGVVDVKIRGLVPQVSYDFSVQSFNRWGLTAGGE